MPESRSRPASASFLSTTTCLCCLTSCRSICAALPRVPGIKDYSGNYFWTTNVSAPLGTIRAIGGFDESFSEYGWEDIDVGLRLRARGVKAVFNPRALAYHLKPPLRASSIEAMVRQ